MINYSKTALKIINSNKGYRTEAFSGSGERNVREVIKFEKGELGNTDILEFLQDNYRILEEYKISQEEFKELQKSCDYSFKINELIIESFKYMCQENSKTITDDIILFLTKYFSVNEEELEAIWLTDLDSVKKIYLNESEDEDLIDLYNLPECNSYLVISDLDEDGILVIYKKGYLIKK